MEQKSINIEGFSSLFRRRLCLKRVEIGWSSDSFLCLQEVREMVAPVLKSFQAQVSPCASVELLCITISSNAAKQKVKLWF